MIPEENYFKLSALQHFAFCPRQCALIHIEQCWVENQWTVEGRLLHERAHENSIENRKQVRIERNIPISSEKLGIIGQTDVIEFRKKENSKQIVVYPIEYKRGKPKIDHCDVIQLCAQALCLEEMMIISISKGALFYGETRHREEIEFNQEIREETLLAIKNLHGFLAKEETPAPVYNKKCQACSFYNDCLPKIFQKNQIVKYYLEKELIAL